MELENIITKIVNKKLNNPILKLFQEIKIKTILKKSNFIKKNGIAPYFVVVHFIYMIVTGKKISTFRKQSSDSFKKDIYYRLLQNKNNNWRKLLQLSTIKILSLVHKVQQIELTRVLIIDDTVDGKRGKKIEGSCDKLWSNKEKKLLRGINTVSLNYSDGISNFMLDFAISLNNYMRVKLEDFTNELNYRTNGYKRRAEGLIGKSQIALNMVQRAINSGIYADYLLVDSWYSKPIFIKEIREMGLELISRLANNNKIWNFIGSQKTIDAIYRRFKKIKRIKIGYYGKIKYTYFSAIVRHYSAGKLKIVFIKTDSNLIPIVSTNLNLSDEEIIELYKRRWDIEQGYKNLRTYFAFGQEQNRIYEALIARITLSFLTHNLISYINRMEGKSETIGAVFEELEYKLTALAISMEIFLEILEEIAKIEEFVKAGEELAQIAHILGVIRQKSLGWRCEK